MYDETKFQRFASQYQQHLTEPNSPYIRAFYRMSDCVVTFYTSGKVVIQGTAANFYATMFIDNVSDDEAGSDEVGTGDYFGPMVVCACLLKKNSKLNRQLLIDSKKLSDQQILNLAPQIMKDVDYVTLSLEPHKYNELHEKYNLNALKALLHNAAYIRLKNKVEAMPYKCYIDQFAPKDTYFKYLLNQQEIYRNLIFETKAEDNHPSVACASIIARYTFLGYMQQLNKEYQFAFPLGAGEQVDVAIKEFILKYGEAKLNEVSKLHFKNTEKAKALLGGH